jgi:hypothetical protein
MALHTVHLALLHRVMLREVEFSVDFQMAIETGLRVFAGIEDELASSTASRDVFAARAVTGFAARVSTQLSRIHMEPRVRAGGKGARIIGVAIDTGLVARKGGAFNLRRRDNRALGGGAGNETPRHGYGAHQHQSPRDPAMTSTARHRTRHQFPQAEHRDVLSQAHLSGNYGFARKKLNYH